ncbi:MAG: lipopolysaccharide heptosyltransferase II [Candidatus Binatia bacterium]|nr:lipopolysaccharide heptosyltransferase II [Candidatus Binatia bacterium]
MRSLPVDLSSHNRILVKAVNWLGDVVMTLPAMWALRQRYPSAHLGVLVRAELADFFSATPWIDSVIPDGSTQGRRSISSRWRLIRQLRNQGWDAGILLPRSFESALWFYLARIPIRIGVPAQARSWMLTHAVPADLKRPDRHQTLSYLEFVSLAVGCAPRVDPPPTFLPRREGEREPLNKPYVVLAPGAAYGPAKQWPREHWSNLATLFVMEGLHVALIGTQSERVLCDEVAATAANGCTVLAGKTSLLELMRLLTQSRGFVGNDSGASHLAAFLGVPTVAIFGSTDPVRTAPIGTRCAVLYDPPGCSPCLARTCRFGHYECLRRITPDKVVATWQRLAE